MACRDAHFNMVPQEGNMEQVGSDEPSHARLSLASHLSIASPSLPARFLRRESNALRIAAIDHSPPLPFLHRAGHWRNGAGNDARRSGTGRAAIVFQCESARGERAAAARE